MNLTYSDVTVTDDGARVNQLYFLILRLLQITDKNRN